MSCITNICKVLVVAVMLLFGTMSATAGIVGDVVDGAKNVYEKGKDGAKKLIDREVRGLKYIVKVGGKVLKTEVDLATYLASRPAYVVTEYVLKDRDTPPKRSDLKITKLYLDKDCNVIVEIQNIGEGYIVLKKGSKTVDLFLKVNGKNWGGATHKLFDPDKKLIRPQGKLTYKTNLKIKKPTKVTAIIDHLNSVRESNERNNIMAKTLDCNKPDLKIEKIYLNKNCEVVVRVKNIGKGMVNSDVWSDRGPNSPSVYLKINGKGWGGATIAGFDKRKRLLKPGGVAAYRSNLKVAAKANITATIDHTKQIIESNERNNRLKVTLECKNEPQLKAVTQVKPMQMQTQQNNNKIKQMPNIADTKVQGMGKIAIKKPDLVIDKLFLSKDCKIVVKVKNIGQVNIPENIYNDIKIHFSIDGNSWSYISLSGIDPAKKAQQAQGSIIYKTNLKVEASANIGANIDATNVLDESDEANNQFIQTLRCNK